MDKYYGVFNCFFKYCPICGEETTVGKTQDCELDYLAGQAHTCNCGFHFQYVETDKLLTVAEDLKYYHKGGL
jgi:hypothetical protein